MHKKRRVDLSTLHSKYSVARLLYNLWCCLSSRGNLLALRLLWALSALLGSTSRLYLLNLWALSLLLALYALGLWLAARLTTSALLLRLSTTRNHSY